MNLPEDVWHHLPGWVSALILVLGFTVYILSKLSRAYEPVARAIPVLGRYWREKSHKRHDNDVDSQLADLQRQVDFLTVQLSELRVRDEMYWAWILSDQEWHRQHEFTAAQRGYETHPHIPFMEFRDSWMKMHYSGAADRRRPREEESPF